MYAKELYWYFLVSEFSMTYTQKSKNLLKETSLITSDFFKLSEILVSEKAHIFLIAPGESYSWKMYCMEDINENVTSYGNHN